LDLGRYLGNPGRRNALDGEQLKTPVFGFVTLVSTVKPVGDA
jgi:hypothetical protein